MGFVFKMFRLHPRSDQLFGLHPRSDQLLYFDSYIHSPLVHICHCPAQSRLVCKERQCILKMMKYWLCFLNNVFYICVMWYCHLLVSLCKNWFYILDILESIFRISQAAGEMAWDLMLLFMPIGNKDWQSYLS